MKPITLLDQDKIEILRGLAKSVSHLAGDAAELGVYLGGSAHVIASALPNKRVYLLDTFQGMPFQDYGDFHQVGEFGDTSVRKVMDALNDCPNTILLPGIFPDDTGYAISLNSFCFVHLDADQYRSTIDALNFFYPRLVTGGVIVFDDYEWKNCPGVKKAIDEFFQGRNEKVISKASHQSYICKCL